MASAYLSRTNGTSTLQTKFTFSAWVKRTGVSSSGDKVLMGEYTDSNNRMKIQFKDDDFFEVYQVDGGNVSTQIKTNRKFRDTSAWYHIVVAQDSAQSTSSDRLKIYVNGVQETSFSISTYPSNSTIPSINENSKTITVGNDDNGGSYFDGVMAHVNFIDGLQLTPTTFGETDATTGIWKPKTAPSVTYGTNGFFLKFDNSANMGLDSAGSNNLTTSGTIIQTKDTPSNVFAKINLLDNYYNGQASGSLSVINTKIQTAGSGTETYTLSTLGASKGKYYCEMKLVSSTAAHQTRFGIAYESSNGTADWLGKRAVGWSLRQDGTPTNNNSTISGTFASYTAGDIVSMAVDLDNSKLYFRKNNDAWMNSGDPTSGSTGTGAISITAGETYLIGIGDETGGYSVCELNFGDGYFGTTAVASAENPDDGIGIFEYDVPAGYRALCTKSLNAQEYS